MTKRSSAVTIRDVARQAGVSVATVSRYINRITPVSEEVAERLDRVMAELKYKPHAAAQHLASRKTHVIGFLLTNIQNDFFAPLLNGIESVVRQRGYNLLVATYHSNSRNEMPPSIGPHNTDGLLIFADSLTDGDLANLHANGFPMVLVHQTPPASLPIPSVTVENKSAAHRLVEHLIVKHNKSRILFMRGPSHQEDSQWREAGYKSALEANGIPFDENRILVGEFDRTIAHEAMKKFLEDKQHATFDAVFAGDDDSAIGAINALTESGYRIPQDVAVVGFDDLNISEFLNPPLTTVRAPTETVGQIATEKLFGLLNGEISNEIILLPTEIIIRRSCGCQS